jgi:hypothetical protein
MERQLFKSSLVIFLLLGLSLLSIGVLYLSIDEFMPYHSEAVQADWSELDVNYQGLILGLLKALGGGAFVAGAATIYMAITSFRRSAKPYMVLLPSVSTGYSGLLCYATYTVQTSTPGDPPLLLTVIYVVMGLVASALLTFSIRAHDVSQIHSN